jgi:hypothetical protein
MKWIVEKRVPVDGMEWAVVLVDDDNRIIDFGGRFYHESAAQKYATSRNNAMEEVR